VKDLWHLIYFLGIKVTRGPKGSQRKYMLDLLKEINVLGCKHASVLIDKKLKPSAEASELIDKEMYQMLVDRLIYLSHTRSNIYFAMNMMSCYMHDPRKGHMDTVY
jgi:hypothetical protein